MWFGSQSGHSGSNPPAYLYAAPVDVHCQFFKVTLAHDNEILGKFLICQNSRPKTARLLSDLLLIVISIVTQIKWMRFKVINTQELSRDQCWNVWDFSPDQFSSFCFDNPGNAASPINRRFSCRSWAPLVGDSDDIITELTWVTINGIAQTCFSGRAKGKFLFSRHTTLQQKNQRL